MLRLFARAAKGNAKIAAEAVAKFGAAGQFLAKQARHPIAIGIGETGAVVGGSVALAQGGKAVTDQLYPMPVKSHILDLTTQPINFDDFPPTIRDSYGDEVETSNVVFLPENFDEILRKALPNISTEDVAKIMVRIAESCAEQGICIALTAPLLNATNNFVANAGSLGVKEAFIKTLPLDVLDGSIEGAKTFMGAVMKGSKGYIPKAFVSAVLTALLIEGASKTLSPMLLGPEPGTSASEQEKQSYKIQNMITSSVAAGVALTCATFPILETTEISAHLKGAPIKQYPLVFMCALARNLGTTTGTAVTQNLNTVLSSFGIDSSNLSDVEKIAVKSVISLAAGLATYPADAARKGVASGETIITAIRNVTDKGAAVALGRGINRAIALLTRPWIDGQLNGQIISVEQVKEALEQFIPQTEHGPNLEELAENLISEARAISSNIETLEKQGTSPGAVIIDALSTNLHDTDLKAAADEISFHYQKDKASGLGGLENLLDQRKTGVSEVVQHICKDLQPVMEPSAFVQALRYVPQTPSAQTAATAIQAVINDRVTEVEQTPR